jgi:hypothetical protein
MGKKFTTVGGFPPQQLEILVSPGNAQGRKFWKIPAVEALGRPTIMREMTVQHGHWLNGGFCLKKQ